MGTAVNRQGNDVGTQYRTGIYYVDQADRAIIDRSIAVLQTAQTKPVAVEVALLDNYYPAEAYHQKYLDRNPTGYCHIPSAKFAQARTLGKKE